MKDPAMVRNNRHGAESKRSASARLTIEKPAARQLP